MTAGIQAAVGAAAAANCLPFTVTVGQDVVSPNFKGFNNGSFGSCSPGTYKGITITQITSFSGSFDFLIILNGTGHPQSIFRQVVVELNSANSFVPFTSAAAVFSDSGSFCSWGYGSGSGPVWTTNGIVRRVLIFS